MAAFTEMGPGASLHYLTGDQQQAQSYSFASYGQPMASYHQQPMQQQQQQPQQMQRSRQGGPGLPPTPPGSPRPHVAAAATAPPTQPALHDSAIKQQQPSSTFTSPVRTQHPSNQQQSLPLYPHPSPLHPNMQNTGNAVGTDSSAMFAAKHQQPQQHVQQPMLWSNQPTAVSQSQTTTFESAPNGSFPATSTSPSLVHALSQAAQQRRQRSEKKQVPDDLKDDKYYERRKRNNVAAKKSRDSRKAREDEIAIRASFLEKENAILRAQVATLRDEASSLRQLLVQKQVTASSTAGPTVPRPTASSTPNAKQQAFSMATHQQQQQQPQQQSLAAVVAQQAAAAAYAAAFASSNIHHNQQVLGHQTDNTNQQTQQQEVIHSAA